MADDAIRIGRFTVDFERAKRWIKGYTNAESNKGSDDPYAYPAYDEYDRDSNNPSLLTDGDLLAPILLNVRFSIRSYYGLQKIRHRLEAVLADDDLAKDLADLPQAKVSEAVSGIYGLLDHEGDDEDLAPWGVRATTLSKIVHRKRPTSLALHDRWVSACYLGSEAVPPKRKGKTRSSAEYMELVTLAIAEDLHSQREIFERLQEESLASPRLTDLRLLDILAWHRGQGRK